MFSSRIPLTALIAWVRALKHGTDAGLSPVRIFRQQAESGPPGSRALASTIAERLAEGDSLEDALAPESRRFPQVVLELIAVGEQTGRLSETFHELENYLDMVRDSRTRFYRAMIWPGMMYFGAIGVIAMMLLVLGLIAPASGQAFDPLGLGLLGPSGSVVFLIVASMVTATILLIAMSLRDNESLRARCEGMALTLPVLGDCVRSFALQRFSLAMMMATEAGMRADAALALAFRAATNEAFTRHLPHAVKEAQAGQDITTILENCGPTLFPADFRDAVEVGELTGQLPEVFAKQSEQFREAALRKLALLSLIASGSVYVLIAGMIILVIIRIFLSIANIYQDAMRGL